MSCLNVENGASPLFSARLIICFDPLPLSHVDDVKLATEHPRMKREKKTIDAMVHIYCKNKHESKGALCPECTEFLEYAFMRLDKCPFQEKKTTCAHCPIHCYQPEKRQKAKTIMRYAGPRMLLHHPGLALHHVWDGRKKPEKPSKKPAQT